MTPKREMVSGWDVKRLGELADIVGGGTPVRNVPAYWNGDIPWVTPTEITELRSKYIRNSRELITESGLRHSSARLLPVGTVLMTSRASIGYAAINTVEMATNQGFQSLICRPGFNNFFAFHVIQSIRSSLEREATGTTFLEISSSKVKRFELLVPPENEQREIARVLDAADEAIVKTEALISKLKAIKQGLLHDLLTRGLDDNGQLRDPEKHPEQFKDSSLGRIPDNWTVEPLCVAADKVQDGTHFSPKSTAGPYRYLTSKNIRFGTIDLTDSGWISEKEHRPIYSRCDVRPGDVLLTKDGANTGNAAIYDLSEEVSLLSSVAFIRCDNDELVAQYLLQYFLSPIGQRRLKDLMSGVAITRLTVAKIRDFHIPLPDPDEQGEISRRLNIADCRISAEQAYLSKLKAIKKGLMQDLLTGRVRVPEAMLRKAEAAV